MYSLALLDRMFVNKEVLPFKSLFSNFFFFFRSFSVQSISQSEKKAQVVSFTRPYFILGSTSWAAYSHTIYFFCLFVSFPENEKVKKIFLGFFFWFYFSLSSSFKVYGLKNNKIYYIKPFPFDNSKVSLSY